MNNYHIGVYRIIKKENYLDSNMIAETEILYQQFDNIFCTGSLTADVKEICGQRQHFENAGILFFTFSTLGNILVIYSILGMLGIMCKCSSLGVVTVEVIHYIYPGLYATSLILYVSVSRISVLSTPTGYSSSVYGPGLDVGMGLMIVAMGLSIASASFFFFTKKFLKTIIKIQPEKKAKGGLRKRTSSKSSSSK